jgi:cyclopropane fatty-acyl-phospholipid synthase-like methyltransferase
MAGADMQRLERLLDLEPGGRVLDAPCGDGRLTVRIAARGCTAIGIDLAEDELVRGRAAAAAAGVGARFLAGDLRSLPDVGPVDAVVSWGNSFGYLIPAETARSLAGMRRALRPGGRLVLESLTVAEALLASGVEPEAEYEFGGVRMTATNRYRPEESRLESDYVFTDLAGTLVEHRRSAHHVHTTGEVVRMLRAAGFAEVALFGGDATSPYELGDPRLIAVAEAPARRPRGARRPPAA